MQRTNLLDIRIYLHTKKQEMKTYVNKNILTCLRCNDKLTQATTWRDLELIF